MEVTKFRRAVAQRNFPVPHGHVPHPLPPPTHKLSAKRVALWRGRGRKFYTSHFKGGDGRQWRPSIAGLRCHSGRSWTVPTGHQDPPRTPRFRRKARAFLQTGRFRWLRCYPPPYPLPRTHSSEGGRCAGAGGGVLFYRSHFKGGLHPPLEPPMRRGSKGK